MSDLAPESMSHRRASNDSTVRGSTTRSPQQDFSGNGKRHPSTISIPANLWVHDDAFSSEDILVNESILEGSGIQEGSLIEILSMKESSEVRDFQPSINAPENGRQPKRAAVDSDNMYDDSIRYLCLAKFAQAEFKAKQANLQISVKSNIAAAFGFRSRCQVLISLAEFEEWTASHVELGFRDAYLARSDMWRLVGQELAGKTVYSGQKITFLGSIKVTVKAIHVRGHKVPTAFFSGNTVPVFRSEAARYVVFIQMSREMWDFDSEGNGEILFNRVINGFLSDLFKRWTELEVRHLVSIVLFGRLEYSSFDLSNRRETNAGIKASSSSTTFPSTQHQDFYRVVVTDMASAQWTTILDELKKDFRVYLRDISLYPPKEFDLGGMNKINETVPAGKITGKPSTAMKGNILEAINIASSQFANDYVDRDLIRTGVSVVVITAGTGVFEVERDLLNLTSENLTNNGVGIDVVCLSKMPLHSVPLFKYRLTPAIDRASLGLAAAVASSPRSSTSGLQNLSAVQSQDASPDPSSVSSMQRYSNFLSSMVIENPRTWCYGIPHWIDLSYWSSESPTLRVIPRQAGNDRTSTLRSSKGPFIPRVRMYEVQMMGLMEMGMADISVPFMSETYHQRRPRRKRAKSNAQNWRESRNLSQPLTLSREGPLMSTLSQPAQGLLSTNAKLLGEIFDRMDDHDENIFRQITRNKPISLPKKNKIVSSRFTMEPKADLGPNDDPKDVRPVEEKNLNLEEPKRALLPSITQSLLSMPTATIKKSPDAARAARNVSYALRGLAPPMRALASTEVNVENAQAYPSTGSPAKARPTNESSSGSIRSFSTRTTLVDNTERSPLKMSEMSPKTSIADGDKASKPIRINASARDAPHDKSSEYGQATSLLSNATLKAKAKTGGSHASNSGSEGNSGGDSCDDDSSIDFQPYDSLPSSVPKSTVPFIRNVNASNPLKRHPNKASYFGRWQHLYPRKPRAATVKWRSLCTPASVPLTTEDFPTKEELETEYETSSYTVALEETNELREEPETRDKLLREILCLRFAHGYQLVVGSRMIASAGAGSCSPSFFFNPDQVRPDGVFIFMAMGNTIQKLTLVETSRIQVTRYVRRSHQLHPPFPLRLGYNPHIRTILSGEYKVRSIELRGFSEQYPWELADRYLSTTRSDLEDGVELLRFWRARFVLLPVEPPVNAWRAAPSESEENEEEIHLRGIRALTQMWQKSRFIPPDERRPAHNRMSAMRKKDRNPLQINMETLNPSELVATELDKLLAAEEAGEVQTTQLLPESEQFERETATLPKLAAAIQGERGIEIKNRRWHLRLHYSCFQGEEFTNWLVYNFRDIDTRGEAVEFGNDLMKEGLFEHVNSRHNFKDGNFFYSIKGDWRAPRQETRQSWFPTSRRSDRSIPPTPIVETAPREAPLSGRSRSGSSLATQPGLQQNSELSKTLSEKKRLAVSLSKMIRLDVDHRRRSNRPEIINLHYDRLHNPENCYHLELSWLNVTSKLVDDAIVAWTSQAERYGLKLVEVPIAEACKVPNNEPFRAPFRIKLISEPPKRSSNGNVFFTATSFGPQAPLNFEVHLYQKALLKRFNFVLDLEAVSEFPENVDISYSWGKLDYNYTQFIHRSGVILAQITDDGDFLLLANRLYNSRLASTKDTTSKFDSKKDTNPTVSLRPPIPPSMQASGIIGLNVQSPSPHPSPMVRPSNISADVLGSRKALGSSGLAAFVTPEQIKDDLEAFCHDKEKLETFYREVMPARKSGSTSSSMLKAVRDEGPPIPEFKLPEALASPRRKGTG